MEMSPSSQILTYDEKKAAEAAFAGRPFDPKWSERARTVYDGIVKALPQAHAEEIIPASTTELASPEELSVTPESQSGPELPASKGTPEPSQNIETVPVTIAFQRAIEAGSLIDVTPAARQLGFSFPITVTKPLWDIGIAPTDSTSQEEQSGRLRDVLMAFRLRLTAQPTLSPLIDFAALLALPPNTVPQPVPMFALIQADGQNRAMATLLLPNEMSAGIIPLN